MNEGISLQVVAKGLCFSPPTTIAHCSRSGKPRGISTGQRTANISPVQRPLFAVSIGLQTLLVVLFVNGCWFT